MFLQLRINTQGRSVSFMESKNNPKSRENDLVIQELKSELMIYDLKINKVFSLNETSAMIWNLCDGKNSVTDISGQLSKKLKQPVTDDLVWLAIEQFKSDDLLANNTEVATKFDGLSRRQVVRQIGLTSVIALPMIAGIVAPKAAAAASNPSSAACATINQCIGANTTSFCPTGCTSIVTIVTYFSTDGSCTNVLNPGGNTINCTNLQGQIFLLDTLRIA